MRAQHTSSRTRTSWVEATGLPRSSAGKNRHVLKVSRMTRLSAGFGVGCTSSTAAVPSGLPQDTTLFGSVAALESLSGPVASPVGYGSTYINVDIPAPTATTARKKTKADFIAQYQKAHRAPKALDSRALAARRAACQNANTTGSPAGSGLSY